MTTKLVLCVRRLKLLSEVQCIESSLAQLRKEAQAMSKHDVLAKEIDLHVAKQKLVCAVEEINLKLANLQYDYLGAKIAEEAEEAVQQAQHTEYIRTTAAAEERAEILSAIRTAIYVMTADAPGYAGLMQAINIINTRG